MPSTGVEGAPALFATTGDLPAAPSEVPLGPRDPHGPAIVMRTCEPDLVTDVSDERLRALGVESTLCVPLPGRGAPIGTLTLLARAP